MKKKVLAVALAVALIAIMVSGTLAYFTAEDKVTNTFTIGSVLIDIYENNDITDEDTISFTEPLIPIVKTDAPSTDANYIFKAVKVKSSGENPAYIRTHIAVPAALKDYLKLDLNTADGWTYAFASEATVDGVDYMVYAYDYANPVAKDQFTTDLLKGVYLDSKVDLKDNPDTDSADLEFCIPYGDGTYTFSGFVAHSKTNAGYTTNKVNVLVASEAIQSQGFDSANQALTTGFGWENNPWK